ncbi:hypothetical protein K474DRAFT_512065 [Panus rudis PR-1116 ss-1]|nr:hypothetical protein K474DRAFT_512065 [Panus rudis PR-1116 ss-1]
MFEFNFPLVLFLSLSVIACRCLSLFVSCLCSLLVSCLCVAAQVDIVSGDHVSRASCHRVAPPPSCIALFVFGLGGWVSLDTGEFCLWEGDRPSTPEPLTWRQVLP